jgi:hypothetical protein
MDIQKGEKRGGKWEVKVGGNGTGGLEIPPVAFLIFFTAPTGAGLVWTNFLRRSVWGI